MHIGNIVENVDDVSQEHFDRYGCIPVSCQLENWSECPHRYDAESAAEVMARKGVNS